MPSRPRLSLRHELALAVAPTLVVLLMLAGVEAFERQRLLFASLASSAFFVYRDPGHPRSGVRTVLLAQTSAALVGFGADWFWGAGLLAAGTAIVLTVLVIIPLRVMHPPAMSTALTFGDQVDPAGSLGLFGFALLLLVSLLVVLQVGSLWLVRRYRSDKVT